MRAGLETGSDHQEELVWIQNQPWSENGSDHSECDPDLPAQWDQSLAISGRGAEKIGRGEGKTGRVPALELQRRRRGSEGGPASGLRVMRKFAPGRDKASLFGQGVINQDGELVSLKRMRRRGDLW